MSRINIRVWSSAPSHACSYYRSWGPFSRLYKLDPSVTTSLITDVNWPNMANCDIFFLESPQIPESYNAMRFAKQLGVKVWVDIGDDLLHIPAYNPVCEQMANETRRHAIRECVTDADVVTCLSEELRVSLLPYNKNVFAVPNAFNDYTYSFPDPIPNKNKIINWRGNDHHLGDILPVSRQIIEVAETFPDWTWAFMGYDPRIITDSIKKSIFINHQPLTEFVRQMYFLQPSIQLKPLLDNSFNRCKSNIAWIEGTVAGAATLGPRFPEWEKPGITTYKDPEEFKFQLQELMKWESIRVANQQMSLEFIMDTLRLSIINKKRLEICEQLMDNRPPATAKTPW